ncbi:MAG: hypothetical protein AAB152_18165 [Candidatus Coatesbacteria bacterium]
MHNHGPLAGAIRSHAAALNINPLLPEAVPQCYGLYGLTVVGAIVYFIKNAVGFWGCVVGFLKGCVWPAIVVYKPRASVEYPSTVCKGPSGPYKVLELLKA